MAALVILAALAPDASALPSFARQTGQRCAACHVGGDWPQLTPWGRFFKLSAYTAGEAAVTRDGWKYSPVGAFGQAGVTWAAAKDNAQGQPVIEPTNSFRAEQVVGYLGTKVADFAGVFFEYQYGNNFPGWTGGTGVFDARAVHFFRPGGHELLVGLDVNNGPSNQDVWNTVPAWGYPFYGSPIAPGAPAGTMLSTVIGQSAGIGAYALLDRQWYLEVSAYRAATGFWRWTSWGTDFDQGGAQYLASYNPYWRLYYTREWGPHVFMAGTYGMYAKVFPNSASPNGATDKFTDYYLDTQYQYLADIHKVTLRAYYYYERQSWDASYPLGISSIQKGNLNGFNLSGTYSFRDTWSASLAYYQSNGSGNAALYGVYAPNGVTLLASAPNTTGYVAQVNFLPVQNVKLQLQYSGFTRFNGLTSDIDGLGRKPGDNNTLWFNVFVAI
jgi:hypothetical protein